MITRSTLKSMRNGIKSKEKSEGRAWATRMMGAMLVVDAVTAAAVVVVIFIAVRDVVTIVTKDYKLPHGLGDLDAVQLVLVLLKSFCRRCIFRFLHVMLVLHPSSRCDVCLDPYSWETPDQTPHAIPCGHIFCKSYDHLYLI